MQAFRHWIFQSAKRGHQDGLDRLLQDVAADVPRVLLHLLDQTPVVLSRRFHGRLKSVHVCRRTGTKNLQLLTRVTKRLRQYSFTLKMAGSVL